MSRLTQAVSHLRAMGYTVIRTPSGYVISTATGELRTIAPERLEDVARQEGMR